jgi:hypothetical protein
VPFLLIYNEGAIKEKSDACVEATSRTINSG